MATATDDPNVTLTIRLIMQGKVSLYASLVSFYVKSNFLCTKQAVIKLETPFLVMCTVFFLSKCNF